MTAPEPRVMPRDVLREAAREALREHIAEALALHERRTGVKVTHRCTDCTRFEALAAVPSESDAGPRDVLNESVQELVRHLGLTEAYARLARP